MALGILCSLTRNGTSIPSTGSTEANHWMVRQVPQAAAVLTGASTLNVHHKPDYDNAPGVETLFWLFECLF